VDNGRPRCAWCPRRFERPGHKAIADRDARGVPGGYKNQAKTARETMADRDARGLPGGYKDRAKTALGQWRFEML
jgi:hypothetical protein